MFPSCKVGGSCGIVTFLAQTPGGPLAQPGWHRLVSDPRGPTDIRLLRLRSPGPALSARSPPTFVLSARQPAAMDPGTGVVKGASPSTTSLVELPEVYVAGIIPGPSRLVSDTGAQTCESLGLQRTAASRDKICPPGKQQSEVSLIRPPWAGK